jgi:hypothetical protein
MVVGIGANTRIFEFSWMRLDKPSEIMESIFYYCQNGEINEKIDIQVSLVIRGRFFPSFWTSNLEFADKKCLFDYKIVILEHFRRSE